MDYKDAIEVPYFQEGDLIDNYVEYIVNAEKKRTEKFPNEYDSVNHPKHYNSHPSGIECIEIVKHMDFCIGCAIKYLWRCGLKDDNIQDLKKALWYIEQKIKMMEEIK